MAETIHEAYLRRNPKSAALQSRFQHVFPAGVSHDMRAVTPLSARYCPWPGHTQVGR